MTLEEHAIEIVIMEIPRLFLQKLLENGVTIDRPIDKLSDDDCRVAIRMLLYELKSRENIQ